ncbi:MAG: twin-arginine translocation signal domain-containing protein [Hyphomicrobiaceae bacterium]|nr:twin-arginine translocation signal domain-containing protein [Hyphomicrobiaceae bacterium]
MAEENDRQVTDRRSFLKLASVGAVATGAAVVVGQNSASASETGASRDDGRYQETQHVRRYYDLARF